MNTIIVFGASLIIAFALIALKAIELKYQKRNFILRLFGLFDTKTQKLLVSIKFRTLQIIQTVRYLALVHSKNVAKETVSKMQNRIKAEYELREGALMGKRNIANRGSVSFYLKKITEEKLHGEKGRIEEELA